MKLSDGKMEQLSRDMERPDSITERWGRKIERPDSIMEKRSRNMERPDRKMEQQSRNMERPDKKGMRYMLKAELKNHILNLRFWAGVLLILAAALVSEQTHLQFLLDSGGSREGPGWFLAYSFCSGGEHTLLFVPIAVTFAAGGEAEQELHSRFALFSCVRTGKKQYLAGKAAGLILSGGLMLSVSMLLMLGISVLVFGDIPVLGGGGPAFSTVLLQVLVSFPRGFLNGALWAMAGGFAAIVTRSRYLAYAVPFVLYYVLSVFQERYFRRFLFLNPRYWMAPVYFNDLICILILLALCALTGFLFIQALKRRLDDA